MCLQGRTLFRGPVTRGDRRKIGIDEPVQIAVHDAVDVAGLVTCTGVLNQGVGHEDIGTDLAAPFDLQLDSLQVGDFLRLFLHLQFPFRKRQ